MIWNISNKEFNEWQLEITLRRWKHADQRMAIYDGGTFKQWHFLCFHLFHIWDYEGQNMLDLCPNCEKHMKWIKKRGTENNVQCPMCKQIYTIIEERYN